MQYSDVSTKLGLVQAVDDNCDSDSTSYPIEDKTRNINIAYEYVVGLLIGLDGTWQFDDTNYSTRPIGVTTLVANQQDYSFDVSHLNIERVECKDAAGIWQKLTPIDKSDIDIALPEYFKTPGMPIYYDKDGSSLLLYPMPDSGASVTLTSGLRVHFQRTASLFTSSDTTKVPGFASPYHPILSYLASIPYCIKYHPDRVAKFQAEADRIQAAMTIFYAKREKDVPKRIQNRRFSFR